MTRTRGSCGASARGKIAASWLQTDRLGFLQEMGAVSKDLGRPPPPASK